MILAIKRELSMITKKDTFNQDSDKSMMKLLNIKIQKRKRCCLWGLKGTKVNTRAQIIILPCPPDEKLHNAPIYMQ